jgi:hypothetical protein
MDVACVFLQGGEALFIDIQQTVICLFAPPGERNLDAYLTRCNKSLIGQQTEIFNSSSSRFPAVPIFAPAPRLPALNRGPACLSPPTLQGVQNYTPPFFCRESNSLP